MATTREPTAARFLQPLRDFLSTEIAGGVVLAAAALTALAWANSPWKAAYESIWGTRASLDVVGRALDLDLRHWLNEGVMSIFVLVVGLEIKRELTHGHLKGARAAAVPLAAALGGMAVPALLYLAIASRSEPSGWGVPMATDIALALGVVALAGSRVPASTRALLLGLAIVDDIGAIIVIALFYSSGTSWTWLSVAALSFAGALAARRVGVRNPLIYVAVGTLLWFALYQAGVHPTLAGVAMGLLAPSGDASVIAKIEPLLHRFTSYLVVPLFALANAGIAISKEALGDAFGSSVFWGIALGLSVGKPIGIITAAGLARRVGPPTAGAARGGLLLGVGTTAGIGFTVAIFVAELAFHDEPTIATAKLAVLAASIVSAIVGLIVLRSEAKHLATSGGEGGIRTLEPPFGS